MRSPTCAQHLRPVDFEDREELEEALSEQLAARADERRASTSLFPSAETSASSSTRRHQRKQSYDQRFRVLKPNARAIQEAFRSARVGAAAPHRVFDISHIQEGNGGIDGGVGRRPDEKIGLPEVHHQNSRRRRRFCLHARSGHARYKRLCEKKSPYQLVLIDGGLGQTPRRRPGASKPWNH